LWRPRIFCEDAVINYSFCSIKLILHVSYCQRPTVGQVDSELYQELAEPELNNTTFKNPCTSTSMSHIRLQRDKISCILLFKTYFLHFRKT
jgi:hypothetical protein